MSRGVALFKSTGTTGGSVDKMDSIDGNTGGPGSTPLQQGDINFLYSQQEEYWVPYELDVDSGQPENDPLLISPDTNAGDKRWRIRFVRWLKNAINYAGNFIIKEAGKGLVLGDGAHDGSGFRLYKPSGNNPVRLVPISDTQGIAIRNAADDADVALFKAGGVDISGLVEPSSGSDPATKTYVDGENSFQANGSAILPGGLTMKWGLGISSTDNDQTFDFPAPFATACGVVLVNRVHANASNYLPVVSWTKTGFTINRTSEINDNQDFSYFAIGW